MKRETHHPSYSPDIAPTDYQLFRSLQHHLINSLHKSYDELRHDLATFIESKPAEFYEQDINQLPELWAKVIEQSGQYFIDLDQWWATFSGCGPQVNFVGCRRAACIFSYEVAYWVPTYSIAASNLGTKIIYANDMQTSNI